MNISRILFINTTSMPGAHNGSRSCAVKPEWTATHDAVGVHVQVPGKPTYLYPWGGIERIEYSDVAEEKRGPGRPKSVAA